MKVHCFRCFIVVTWRRQLSAASKSTIGWPLLSILICLWSKGSYQKRTFSIRSSEWRVCIHCNNNPTNWSIVEKVCLKELFEYFCFGFELLRVITIPRRCFGILCQRPLTLSFIQSSPYNWLSQNNEFLLLWSFLSFFLLKITSVVFFNFKKLCNESCKNITFSPKSFT